MLTGIGSRLDKIEGWKEGIGSDVRILKQSLDENRKQNGELRQRIDQQIALVRIDNPSRIVGIIRGEIDVAEKSARMIPAMQLQDYKNALLSLPQSATGYRQAVYDVINYESALRQSAGLVPDPLKTAKPCPFFGGRGNRFESNTVNGGLPVIRNCLVVLDSNSYGEVVFQDCVVRYKGGAVQLRNVVFINCRFVFEFEPSSPGPMKLPEQKLVFAILQSPQQSNVRVPVG